MTIEKSITIIYRYLTNHTATHTDIVKGAGQTGGAVHHALKVLHTAGKIHIAEYQRSGDRWLRAYKAGRAADAAKPAAAKPAITQRAQATLLKLQGADMTMKQLAGLMACSEKTMISVLKHMRVKNQAHICRYERDSSGHAVYVYRAGAGVDQTPPRKCAVLPKPAFRIPPPDPLMAAFFGR